MKDGLVVVGGLLLLVGAGQAFLPGRIPASTAARRPSPLAAGPLAAAAWSGLTPAVPAQPTTMARFSTSPSATDAAAGSKTKLSPKRRQALEAEFKRAAGKDGFVTLDAFVGIKEVAELLKDMLLARSEVDSFWQGEVGSGDQPADVEAFMAVYARIDALFEDDEDEEDDEEDLEEEDEAVQPAAATPAAAAAPPGSMTLQAFLASPDVARYVEEELVTVVEVQSLWAAECARQRQPAIDAPLGREGQMKVYAAIEELFEEVGQEEAEETPSQPVAAAAAAAQEAVDAVVPLGEDPEVWRAFVGASQAGAMDVRGFLQAGEMPELLREELLTEEEARRIWAEVAGGGAGATVDIAGYKRLLAAVDELFVDDGDEEEEEEEEEQQQQQQQQVQAVVAAEAPVPAATTAAAASPAAAPADSPAAARAELLSLLQNVRFAGLLDPEDANVKARDEAVGALVEAMLDEADNLAVRDDLEIKALEAAVEGEWDLAYTTSRTMRYNRGLSGLGSSLPKAEFLGLEQRIAVNGYALETVYTERLKTLGRPLDVVVEGAWELRDVVSIMDGEVCLIMDVLPAVIKYGFITEKLETGWKGVRVLNRCELLYLDANLRVMKGQSNDSYFVFRRKQPQQ